MSNGGTALRKKGLTIFVLTPLGEKVLAEMKPFDSFKDVISAEQVSRNAEKREALVGLDFAGTSIDWPDEDLGVTGPPGENRETEALNLLYEIENIVPMEGERVSWGVHGEREEYERRMILIRTLLDECDWL